MIEYFKVEDFAQVITGGTPSTKNKAYWEDGHIPWLNSGELNQDIIVSSRNHITSIGLEKSAAKLMPKDSVLIALTGATTGVVGYLTFEACANQSVTGILPSEKHFPKFLFYYLKSIRPQVLNDAYGGAQPHISQGYVKQLKIPLPPLGEQKKIAAILDATDDYRQKTKALIDKYDQLTQSLFLDMFGDPVTNPRRFEIVTVRDIIEEAKYGTSSKADENGTFPYLRMNNITYKGHMNYDNLKFINIADDQLHKYETKKGDILFNRTNSKELVGKTGIITTDEKMVLAGYLIRVRMKEGYNPYFLWSHLNSRWAKLTLENMCKSIVGMANINAQELQNLLVMNPPLKIQNQFAERVQAIEAQKAQAQASLAQAEDLFNSLLQRAFKGELTN